MKMIDIDKTYVQKQFNCGLSTYSREAVVQKDVARKLMRELVSLRSACYKRLFEVGCGTGFLTGEILENADVGELMVNDIAAVSKHKIQELSAYYLKHIEFIQGDAEEIDLPQHLDAVLSGSTIQWFKNKQYFFNKVYHSLNPGGILAFSTFGCDNFKEIKSLTGVGLEYKCLDDLVSMLAGKFNILWADEWIDTLEFTSPLDVLRHIKQTGVNAVRQSYFGLRQLKGFTNSYYRRFLSDSEKVTLTYNPIIIIAQKK